MAQIRKKSGPLTVNNNQDEKPTLILHSDSESDSEQHNSFPGSSRSGLSHSQSSETLSKKRRSLGQYLRDKSGSLVTGVGRIPGSILNQLVRAGMNTPIVKYLLNPQALKKALNNDPVLKETYRIILTSDPVRKLLTPEALQIILDSETAKKVITPGNVLFLLNHDVVASFMTRENMKFLLESEIVRNVWSPEAILENMESKTFRGFLKPEIIHEIAYSEFFTRIMEPEFHEGFLQTGGVKEVMTKEAVEDALKCPGAEMTMTQEYIDRLLGVEGVGNLIRHEEFKKQCLRILRSVEEFK